MKKYYEPLAKFVHEGYNTRVPFTFWKLVKTDQGYVVKRYIDLYEEMSVIYK